MPEETSHAREFSIMASRETWNEVFMTLIGAENQSGNVREFIALLAVEIQEAASRAAIGAVHP